MNREIKFRAYVTPLDKILDVINIDLENNEILVIDEKGRDHGVNNLNYELMQYTGLTDKNGKEIYENDILKEVCMRTNEINKVDKVIFHRGCFLLDEGLELWEYDNEMKRGNRYVEVIGNIYENQELIKNLMLNS